MRQSRKSYLSLVQYEHEIVAYIIEVLKTAFDLKKEYKLNIYRSSYIILKIQ